MAGKMNAKSQRDAFLNGEGDQSFLRNKTEDNNIVALDSKFNFDGNAMFRQADVNEMEDPFEIDETELEAGKFNLNYIKLDGNVGCMVNGAGLAMATMDIIKLSGGDPANFLDVGGAASVETVKNGFKIILKDEKYDHPNYYL